MTQQRDFDALMTAYMVDGLHELPDRVADAVLDEVHRTRQRAVLGPWRTPDMNSTIKLVIAAAAVIVVALAGFNLLPRDQGGVAAPNATIAADNSQLASASPLGQTFEMTVAGTEGHVPRNLTVHVPDGWGNAGWWAERDGESGSLSFSVVSNTIAEPCEHVPRSPEVEQTIESVAAGFSEISGTTATAPVPATVAGLDAMYVEVEIPESLPCDEAQFWMWQETPGNASYPTASPQTFRIWVVDVAGQVVAIMTRTDPGTSAETKDQLDAALETIVFDGAAPSSSGG